MVFDIAALLNDSVITFAQIEEFRDEVKETLCYLCSRNF